MNNYNKYFILILSLVGLNNVFSQENTSKIKADIAKLEKEIATADKTLADAKTQQQKIEAEIKTQEQKLAELRPKQELAGLKGAKLALESQLASAKMNQSAWGKSMQTELPKKIKEQQDKIKAKLNRTTDISDADLQIIIDQDKKTLVTLENELNINRESLKKLQVQILKNEPRNLRTRLATLKTKLAPKTPQKNEPMFITRQTPQAATFTVEDKLKYPEEVAKEAVNNIRLVKGCSDYATKVEQGVKDLVSGNKKTITIQVPELCKGKDIFKPIAIIDPKTKKKKCIKENRKYAESVLTVAYTLEDCPF